MAEKIFDLLGPFGEWVSAMVGQDNVLWALGILALAIPGILWLLVRLTLKGFTMSQQWKMRLALDKVIVGLTFAEDDAANGAGKKKLSLRTVEETNAQDVVLTNFAVGMLVRAALFVSKRFPFLHFGRADDEWVMLNSFLNLISEKFSFGYIAKLCGLDVVTKNFVIAITCERGENIRIRKIRLQMVTSQFLIDIMEMLQRHSVFKDGHLASIVSESKSARQAMKRFNDLLDQDGYKKRFAQFADAYGLQYQHHVNRVRVIAMMAVGYYVTQEKRRLHDTAFKADVLMELEIAAPDTNNKVLRKQVADLTAQVDASSELLSRVEQKLDALLELKASTAEPVLEVPRRKPSLAPRFPGDAGRHLSD